MKKYDSKSFEYKILKNIIIYKENNRFHGLKKMKAKHFKLVNESDVIEEILKIDTEIKAAHEYYIEYKNFNISSSYDEAVEKLIL